METVSKENASSLQTFLPSFLVHSIISGSHFTVKLPKRGHLYSHIVGGKIHPIPHIVTRPLKEAFLAWKIVILRQHLQELLSSLQLRELLFSHQLRESLFSSTARITLFSVTSRQTPRLTARPDRLTARPARTACLTARTAHLMARTAPLTNQAARLRPGRPSQRPGRPT